MLSVLVMDVDASSEANLVQLTICEGVHVLETKQQIFLP
jgi:hypothetical protein